MYQTIRIGNSNNLCQINGYKAYTMANDADGSSILVDESGNKYKVAIKFDQNNNKYTGIEVTDSNGKVVTDDFAWLDNYFKSILS